VKAILPLGHLKVTPGELQEIAQAVSDSIDRGERRSCIPINLSKYVLSQKDPKLRQAINLADIVVADGVPIVWLSRRLGYQRVQRVSGVGLAEELLSRAAARSWRVFLLGASPNNLEAAVKSLEKTHPGLVVVGARDGYFSDSDVPGLVREINSASPDLLLLGMGLPQKEYFLLDHGAELTQVKFTITVGGAFDIWAGAKRRSPEFVQRAGLEWLYRSVYDPSRAGLIARYGLQFARELALPTRRRGAVS
jgi:N-acetylglucosaminyldiphosphoundecaprenol N-acetyl-beta-D-mannosaminyltransferase